MKLTVVVVFECAGEREASALRATLSPDNKTLPKGQELAVEQSGRTLRFVIESQRPAAGLSSALSLLSDAKLFQEIWTIAS
jgi:hypothetical protein